MIKKEIQCLVEKTLDKNLFIVRILKKALWMMSEYYYYGNTALYDKARKEID